MDAPPSPGRHTALFLDFDGTLVALAATPDSVHVPPDLPTLLHDLQRGLYGALAIVSGRPIADIDRFLSPLTITVAGEHGAQRRDASGQIHGPDVPDLTRALEVAQALVQRHSELLLERKRIGFALHYRQRPELEALCRTSLADAIADRPELELLDGKCLIEVRPVGFHKGAAIAAYLREEPFVGRAPVFVGDDTTDEDGFRCVQSHPGGFSIKVGDGDSVARHRLAGPDDVLAWLRAWRDTLATTPPRG